MFSRPSPLDPVTSIGDLDLMLPRPPTIRHERDLMVGRGREVKVAPKTETDIQLLDDRRLVARFRRS